MNQCPKCTIRTETWEAATGGVVVAKPCDHRLTFAEAKLAFPQLTAQVMRDLGQKP